MSRTIRLSAAVSLDGFIAGPNGEIDWILMDPDIDFGELMGSYDTVLMGRKSYEDAAGMGGGPWSGMDTYVFSSTLEEARGVTLSRELESTVRRLKSRPGRDIWLFGGGSLFRSMLGLNLVDEVQVAVIPVLLGSGVPLLAPGVRAELSLYAHRLYPKTGTMMLEYRVKHG